MIVVKFGGTSLAGTERMRAAARIVAAHRRDQSVVCVVSAMAGVTDALITTITQAMSGDTAWPTTMAEISTRHHITLGEITTTTGSIPGITTRFEAALSALEADLQRILTTPFETESARAHAIAAFSGWGERLSVLLFAQALAAEGLDAVPYAGEPVIMAERARRAGSGADESPFALSLAPSIAATREHLSGYVADVLQSEAVPVLPGYLGRTRDGLATTLGRNGSDYSAAVVGAALRAESVYLYSTVAGVHRVDPRVVPEADVLPALTYADAAEAAALGAKVLHPATVRPLAAAGIPLRLRNTLNPAEQGTDVGSARHLAPEQLQQSGWVVTARALPTDHPHYNGRQHPSGLVEVTGLFFRHADWEPREDDHLAVSDEDGPADASDGAHDQHGQHDGPVSGALALLTTPPLPVHLALSARRISVTVPAEESAATQRRLYHALTHANARAHARARTDVARIAPYMDADTSTDTRTGRRRPLAAPTSERRRSS